MTAVNNDNNMNEYNREKSIINMKTIKENKVYVEESKLDKHFINTHNFVVLYVKDVLFV